MVYKSMCWAMHLFLRQKQSDAPGMQAIAI